MSTGDEAREYHSKDFEWDELSLRVQNDPSLSYHLLQPPSQLDSSSSSHQQSHAWNDFHTRHSTGKFFKERRYLVKEFPELASSSVVLEVGCGNGSTALPILRDLCCFLYGQSQGFASRKFYKQQLMEDIISTNESAMVYACDCSSEALERAKEIVHASNVKASESRFHIFCCDFSVNGFPEWLACNHCKETVLRCQHLSDDCTKAPGHLKDGKCCIGRVDVVTLIFTLSAVPLNRMPAAISECFSVLKPGGLLLFRDYGLYDMTMLRFEADQKLGYREYRRSDGTLSYFFSLDSARNLFQEVGFIVLELEYCCIKSVNRRNGKTMWRVWVHGKFQKPPSKLLQEKHV